MVCFGSWFDNIRSAMQGIAVKGLCFLCVEQNNKNTDNKTRVGIPCSRLWRRLPNKEFPTVRCGCLPTVAAGNRIVLQTLRGQRQKTLRAVCFGLWVDTGYPTWGRHWSIPVGGPYNKALFLGIVKSITKQNQNSVIKLR